MMARDRQPIRDAIEESTDNIPEGPFGKVGDGTVLGAGGFLAVEASRPLIDFVPGIKQPGYKITAHSTEVLEPGTERHTLTVPAISEEVARFAAKYAATPSNIDFSLSDTEIVSIEELTEQPGYTTHRIVVDVDRGDVLD